MNMSKSKIVVVDSGAFIKNAKVEDYAEEVYTIQAVVKEIRDKQTRMRLQVLPYSIHFREPNPQSISHVSEIAKQTGDFRSLSATDIRVIALTYELHEQFKGIEFSPTDATEIESSRVSKVAYHEAFGDVESDDDFEESDDSEEEADDEENKAETDDEDNSETEVGKVLEGECDEDDNPIASSASTDKHLQTEVLEKVAEAAKYQAMEVSDDEDAADWISADNFAVHDFAEDFQAFKSSAPTEDTSETTPIVSCLTTDFAMQNVLLRLGLAIRSVEGMIVKNPKSFVLWCYACNKHTLDQTKEFCPSCGNKCLRKITASIDEQGKVQLHFAKKFQWRNKGKNKQCDPRFQGGKYSSNRLYTEDQPMPHQRASKKAMQRLDPESFSADCPFVKRDLSSRAAKLGMNKRVRGTRRK